MTNQSRPSLLQQITKGSGAWPPRTLAVLLMLAGAIGFGISLVVFNGQILCLFGSTVVVFAGLWIHVLLRRRLEDSQKDTGATGWEPVEPERLPDSHSGPPRQTPAPVSWTRLQSRLAEPDRPAPQPVRTTPAQLSRSRSSASSLTGQVSEVLRRQGAIVRIEAQREDRSILQVRSPSGMTFTGLVLDGQATVGVSEVRGLYGLMTGSGSSGAFMVSGGSYTPQAREWASQRSLTLLESGQVHEILID